MGAGHGLDDGGDCLAEALVGKADDDGVVDERCSLSASSTSSGKTFSPPVLMHDRAAAEQHHVPSASTRA